MYDHRSFVRTTSQFAEMLVSDYDVHDVLDDLAERLTELLSLSGSGVAVAVNGRLQAVTAVPEHLADLERHQERTQVGPCPEAFGTSRMVTVADLETETRWPDYRAVAKRLGMRAVVGVPMKLGEESVGALNLYSHAPREWDPDDLIAARLLANLATSFLISTSSLSKQAVLNEQLQYALEGRIVIEQAKGVLAEVHSASVERAFERIRGHARSHNVKVVDVARAVVNLGLRP